MYETFYGLNAKPFQLNPDPAFYFPSKQHRRAKAYLDYGVSCNDGFIVITGEVGAGKTTVLRGLLDRLPADQVAVAQLVTTQLDAQDTLYLIGAAFGLAVNGLSKAQLLATLEAFFMRCAAEGRRCLLVVDEAQNLHMRSLEELRMLSNHQLGSQALMQAFLVGQPQFRETLRRADMEQLRQRVAAACHIGPLDEEDTRAYIEHRLRLAGAHSQPVIEDSTFSLIFQRTGGLPRRINSLCHRLMLRGYIVGDPRFKPEDVEEVGLELDAETGASTESRDAGTADGEWRPGDAPGRPMQLDQVDRLEQSLLRLERLNLKMLAALQRSLEKRDESRRDYPATRRPSP